MAGAGMDLIDMSWEKKCREEDMKQRVIENTRRAIDDARRSVDEKAQQLKTLAHQSALIAGFSMVVLVEITIPDDLNPILLVAFGCTTAGVVSLMLTAMLTSTYILVAILRYDCVTREIPFLDFWRRRCEGDWKFALKAFTYGIPLFMMVLAEVGWVSFSDFLGHLHFCGKNGKVVELKWIFNVLCLTVLLFSSIFLMITGNILGKLESKWNSCRLR